MNKYSAEWASKLAHQENETPNNPNNDENCYGENIYYKRTAGGKNAHMVGTEPVNYWMRNNDRGQSTILWRGTTDISMGVCLVNGKNFVVVANYNNMDR